MEMKNKNAIKIANQIKQYISVAPEVGMLLGSGWKDVANLVENPIIVPYSNIKGMPSCHVKGHNGNFIFGKLAGKNVCIMQGRFHYYEGHPISDVVLPVVIMNLLGISKLIVTNAGGGINTRYTVGDVVILNDHINYSFTNPLIGITEADGSVKFTDMTHAYNPQYVTKLKEVCKKLDVNYHTGTYLQVSGPNYETPAEIKMFRTLGADVCGMSTVCEVIVANYLGMQVAGLSFISNMAAGVLDTPLSHAEVIENANKNKNKLNNIILNFVAQI